MLQKASNDSSKKKHITGSRKNLQAIPSVWLLHTGRKTRNSNAHLWHYWTICTCKWRNHGKCCL